MPEPSIPNASTPLPRRLVARALAWLPALLPLLLFFWAGWLGLDFGKHWDQQHRVDDLVHAFEEQTFLPEDYFYPSVTFFLTVAAAAPLAVDVVDLDRETEEFHGAFVRRFLTDEFQVRLRAMFLFVSSLTLLWVFATLLVWRARPLEALVGALALAGSFEVGYHARWVAPDAVLMQFGALCLMACVAVLRTPFRHSWLRAAAVAAGLAAGTKYTGGIFLVPVLLAATSAPRALREALAATLWFAAAFLVSTPGALLEPTRFAADLLFEMRHYQKGHVGYTVEAGLPHLLKNLRYLVLYGPSNWPAVSLVFGALGLVGAVATWRQSRRLALVLLIVPLLFVPYLSTQRVMFVRNLLLVMPVGAILAARGAGEAWDRLRAVPLRAGVVAAVTTGLLANLGFAFHAARSIQRDSPARLAAEVMRWLEAHTDRVVQLSPNVRTLLRSEGHEPPRGHVRLRPGPDVEAVVLFPREGLTQGYWPSNDPDLKVAIGPLSANYDYYATWWTQHVVVIDRDALFPIAALGPMPHIEEIFPELGPDAGGKRGGSAGKDAQAD
jgi:4-amino-4-deoxy-L-arabinose transferase-like glycosyltransferase